MSSGGGPLVRPEARRSSTSSFFRHVVRVVRYLLLFPLATLLIDAVGNRRGGAVKSLGPSANPMLPARRWQSSTHTTSPSILTKPSAPSSVAHGLTTRLVRKSAYTPPPDVVRARSRMIKRLVWLDTEGQLQVPC